MFFELKTIYYITNRFIQIICFCNFFLIFSYTKASNSIMIIFLFNFTSFNITSYFFIIFNNFS